MHIFETKQELQEFLFSSKNKDKSIGFVATMGALHKGHLSLVEQAQKENDIVVVSIFVNPTQFNNKEDLINYPKPITEDIQLLKSINCDVLFCPSADEIYGDNLSSESFNFDGLDLVMEGEFREGHFNGVGTIVKKFFQIVKPTIAYFGEKDFQQLQIIKKMVEKNSLPLQIKGCKILREDDGLAMSSRNKRLSETLREKSPFIYKTLLKAKTIFLENSLEYTNGWVQKEFEKNSFLKLEYFTIADEKTLLPAKEKLKTEKYRAFIAVFADDVRLIDNIQL